MAKETFTIMVAGKTVKVGSLRKRLSLSASTLQLANTGEIRQWQHGRVTNVQFLALFEQAMCRFDQKCGVKHCKGYDQFPLVYVAEIVLAYLRPMRKVFDRATLRIVKPFPVLFGTGGKAIDIVVALSLISCFVLKMIARTMFENLE